MSTTIHAKLNRSFNQVVTTRLGATTRFNTGTVATLGMTQQVEQSVCDCKVGKVVSQFGDESFHQDLVDWWTMEGGGKSTRQMAVEINQAYLRAELRDSGYRPLEGEVENIYQLLTGGEVSEGMRTQTRNRLEWHDIDVDALEKEFVSHQTVYRHLTDCLDESYPEDTREPAEQLSDSRDRMFTLASRCEQVTENDLSRLSKNDLLAIDEFDVTVEIAVTCHDCGTRYELGRLLELQGCDCKTD